MNYKAELIDLINDIKNDKVTEYLYTFVKLFLEKWGR